MRDGQPCLSVPAHCPDTRRGLTRARGLNWVTRGGGCPLPSAQHCLWAGGGCCPALSLGRGRVLWSESVPGAGLRVGEEPRRPGCSVGDGASWGGSCSSQGLRPVPPTPLVWGAPSSSLLALELLCVGIGIRSPSFTSYLFWTPWPLGLSVLLSKMGSVLPRRVVGSVGDSGLEGAPTCWEGGARVTSGTAHPAAFPADLLIPFSRTCTQVYVHTHAPTRLPDVRQSSADLGWDGGEHAESRRLAF